MLNNLKFYLNSFLGEVIKELVYTPFGALLSDTNPDLEIFIGFQVNTARYIPVHFMYRVEFQLAWASSTVQIQTICGKTGIVRQMNDPLLVKSM